MKRRVHNGISPLTSQAGPSVATLVVSLRRAPLPPSSGSARPVVAGGAPTVFRAPSGTRLALGHCHYANLEREGLCPAVTKPARFAGSEKGTRYHGRKPACRRTHVASTQGDWSVPEIERKLNVSRASIYRWLRAGSFPAYRLPGGGWRVPDEAVKRLTATQGSSV